ncbi:MAG: hypothetical protein V3U39_12900, partial [Acidimicrobiia bacterium]
MTPAHAAADVDRRCGTNSAYRFESPIDACELAPGLENTPQHRVSLESNEGDFLSLALAAPVVAIS